MVSRRILVVDDHPIYREGLARSLGEQPDFTVCGEAADADQATLLAESLKPDLILLDLSMPGGGLSALQRIRIADPQARILVLTASEDEEDVYRSLSAGAIGYILKGIGGSDLASVVRAALSGESYVSPALGARLLRQGRTAGASDRPVPVHPRLASLTRREASVLRELANGHSNKEIARVLGIEEKTVKNHVTRVFAKLGVNSRVAAAMIQRDSASGNETGT